MSFISCIGSGVMGRALMKAVAGTAGAAAVGFSDRGPAKAAAAAGELGARAFATNEEAARAGDFIVLAVKPRAIEGALADIAAAVRERLARGERVVLAPVAAGWSIARLRDAWAAAARGGEEPGIIRVMPNTPVLAGQGVIALATSPATPEAAVRELERLLAGAGLVERVDESLFDAITALSGSGPAFAYMFIEALADGAVRAGLDRARAARFAAHTVRGAASLAIESGGHPAALKDAVCSPGGTTIAGVAALEERAFRGAVMSAVDAACRRAQEL